MTDPPFTNPFRYTPHPLVRKAAQEVIDSLMQASAEGTFPQEIIKGFSEGKMLGVLVYRDNEGNIGHLNGFSGSVGGTCTIEGFVPPIFDLTEPGGYYREHEAEISSLTARIREFSLEEEENRKSSLLQEMELEIHELKLLKKQAKTIAESQFANGEIKRAKDRWKARITTSEETIYKKKGELDSLKKLRASMSDELQRWIFEQYIVYNAEGESASILDVFKQKGLTPPGGTGDCAAPKLLNYAFRNGLTPIAMGEFWYGQSPSTAVRTHGHFYPSCTSKCLPLLSYMLKGLGVSHSAIGWGMLQGPPPATPAPPSRGWHVPSTYPHPIATDNNPSYNESIISTPLYAGVIYEDNEIIAVSKESGVPSVPGLDGRKSLQEMLRESYGIEIHAVHRLDMDTSGIILYAKTEEAAVNLRKQFEEHTVSKTYMARLCPADTHRHASQTKEISIGDTGTINLPISADYDERPRQKVDPFQGKPTLTHYEVTGINDDGTTDILFHPHTGRTHQLRVHSAHLHGLGRPLLGDLLYGGSGNASQDCGTPPSRLHLHAYSITFMHPVTGTPLTLTTEINRYQ